VRASIDAGLPVIAFGIIGPPEACLIAGYDTADNAVIGWTFFPDQAGPLEPNGMFRKSDWAKDAWKLVFLGDRVEPTLSDADAVVNGAAALRQTECMEDIGSGYHIGDAAFSAWRAFVETPIDDEAACRERHELHNLIVGTLAEARCFTGGYLLRVAESLEQDPAHNRQYVIGLKQAAALFRAEHDLMWDVWNVLGGNGNPDAWKEFKDPEKRARISAILADAQRLDRLALRYLDRAIAGKQNWEK